jgi:CrcB protein
MKTWIAVGIGGALGSMARHGVSVVVHRLFGETVPYATAIVNVVGCFAIGALAGLLSASPMRMGDTARVLVFVGILGGFTTFSSLGLDTLTLTQGGSGWIAIANIATQIILGFNGVSLGFWLFRQF